MHRNLITQCSWFTALVLYLGVGTCPGQSPWVRSKGGGFVQPSFTTLPKYSRLFLPSGDNFYTERYHVDNTTQLYAEYGLTDKLTVLAIGSFKMEKALGVSPNYMGDTILTESGRLNAPGNPTLAFRFKLPTKKFTSAVQLRTDFPVSSYDAATGLSSGYEAFTFYPMISAGKGFDADNYAFGYAGYAYRTGGYNHSYNLGMEAGRRFWQQLWIIFFLDLYESMHNASVKISEKQALTGFYVPDQEYFAWGFKVIEELGEKTGITAGVGGSFSGNMVAHSPAISVGFYYKWE